MSEKSERLIPGWDGRYFEDFIEGDVYRHPLGRTITTTDNSWLTLLTQNTAPLHFDAYYASQTSWGRPLVDSTLTLALVTGQSVTDVSQHVFANLGWDEVRLPAPVLEGDTIYSQSTVLMARPSKSHGPAVWVRINDRLSDFWHDDLTALAAAPAHRLAGVVLPKTQSGRDVADTAAHLRGGIPIMALIETALGVESATEIASTPVVLALALGSADLRLDDLDAVRRSAARARALGLAAKLCLHPRQIAAVNEAFGYDDRQHSWALRVVAAADNSAGAAVRVDGEMVDRPRLELARRILASTAT